MSGWPRRVGWREGTRSGSRHRARELVVVTAVLAAGPEKEAAHRLGLSHSTVSTTWRTRGQGGSGDDYSTPVDPGAAAA